MRAHTFVERLDLDDLRLLERPTPAVGPREVRLRMRAASLNYRDLVIARAGYAAIPLPLVPVSDGVGEVVAVGEGVTRFAIGDRAIPSYVVDWIAGPPSEATSRRRLGGPAQGVLAEEVVVHEDAAVRAPRHLDDVESATLPIAGASAWEALFGDGPMVPGSTVVVQGTGGVSTFAVLLAKAAGLRTIVVARNEARLARVRALGADLAIESAPGWVDAVRAATDGRGADRVIDVVGGEMLAQSIAATRLGGTVILCGFVGGTTAPLDLFATIRRVVTLRAISGASRASLEALVAALDAHRIRPVVDRVFPFEEARAAYRHLAEGSPFGKVAIAFP